MNRLFDMYYTTGSYLFPMEEEEIGEITGEIKILDAIEKNPGIKRDRLRAITGISLRTIDRIVKRLTNDEKIEYRGSKRTGGWYVRT